MLIAMMKNEKGWEKQGVPAFSSNRLASRRDIEEYSLKTNTAKKCKGKLNL